MPFAVKKKIAWCPSTSTQNTFKEVKSNAWGMRILRQNDGLISVKQNYVNLNMLYAF